MGPCWNSLNQPHLLPISADSGRTKIVAGREASFKGIYSSEQDANGFGAMTFIAFFPLRSKAMRKRKGL